MGDGGMTAGTVILNAAKEAMVTEARSVRSG